MLITFKSSSAVLVTVSSRSIFICNRFRARRANSGKITTSKTKPFFDAPFLNLGGRANLLCRKFSAVWRKISNFYLRCCLLPSIFFFFYERGRPWLHILIWCRLFNVTLALDWTPTALNTDCRWADCRSSYCCRSWENNVSAVALDAVGLRHSRSSSCFQQAEICVLLPVFSTSFCTKIAHKY